MQERIDAGWSAPDVLAAGPLARDRAPAPDDRASKQARVRPEWISTPEFETVRYESPEPNVALEGVHVHLDEVGSDRRSNATFG